MQGEFPTYFCKWNESLLILGTQFAGGMHFLSDSNETFEKLSDKEYPFAFMLSTNRYLMTMSADCLIMWVNQTRKTSRDVEKVGNPKEEGAPSASRYHLAESLLLILALCFHLVFEGIAISIAKSEGDAWRALWMVCLHKVFAAIAMGIALLRMMPQRPFLCVWDPEPNWGCYRGGCLLTLPTASASSSIISITPPTSCHCFFDR